MPTNPDSPRFTLPLGRVATPAARPPGFMAHATSAPKEEQHGELIEDDGDSHALVIAPTGAGKGRSALLPWLLYYEGSVVVVDPKGEAAQVSAAWRSQLGHRVGLLDPWCVCRSLHARYGGPHSFNLMEVMLSDSVDLSDDCMTLAELLAGEAPASLQDPFWRQLALHLIVALLGWIWVRRAVTGVQQHDDRTIAGVLNLLFADDMVYLMATILDMHGKNPLLPAFVRAGFVSFLAHEGEKVRTSVRSEAVSLLRVFTSERVQAATSRTSLPIAELQSGDSPVTIYLVVPPDRLESHAALLRVILGTLLSVMVRRRHRPAFPTLFLVDEVGHLGPIPQLKHAITLLRGYGVKVGLFVQSIAQLKGLWPKDYETILDNCGTWLNFGNASIGSAKTVADHLGDVSADTLFGMGRDKLAIHRTARPTVIASRIDYLHDPLTAGRFDPNPYHLRNVGP